MTYVSTQHLPLTNTLNSAIDCPTLLMATQEYCPVIDIEAIPRTGLLLPVISGSGLSFGPYQLIVGRGFPVASHLVRISSPVLTVILSGGLVN